MVAAGLISVRDIQAGMEISRSEPLSPTFIALLPIGDLKLSPSYKSNFLVGVKNLPGNLKLLMGVGLLLIFFSSL